MLSRDPKNDQALFSQILIQINTSNNKPKIEIMMSFSNIMLAETSSSEFNHKIVSGYLSILDCQDLYPVACEGWGQGGECQKNPVWMKEHCKWTCHQCPGE